MKKKVLIAIFILLIVVFAICIIFLKVDDKNSKNTDNSSNITTEENIQINLEEVKSATAFFTVQSCVNKYIVYVKEKDSDSVYKLLNEDYIQNNNITKDNVLNKIDTLKIEDVESSVTFEATKMYVEELDENNNRYYVLGILKQESLEYEEEILLDNNFKIIVNLDFENMIFSAEPLENGGIFNETNT